jgi:hypothetical protein
MQTQSLWRFAVMIDGPAHDLAKLEGDLARAGDAIAAAVGERPVRLGVAIAAEHGTSHDLTHWRSADAAVEVTFAGEDHRAAPDVCAALRPILTPLAATNSIEVMIGRMFPMVPVKPGEMFLSLAFRRDRETTVEQFRDWWFSQHAPIAIPVLGPELLAYDQVHVDQDLTSACASALGAAFVEYDAYDNLTWADAQAYARSTSDIEGMAVVGRDEEGRIDPRSRRFALMRAIG